jgi:hypothetical protein
MEADVSTSRLAWSSWPPRLPLVGEVTIFCKLHGEGLPKMNCPACRKPLKFHHWLKTETLVPFKGEQG